MAQNKSKKFSNYGKPVAFKRGEKIYETDFLLTEQCIYLILEGKVELVRKYTPIQKEIFVCEKGDIFGILEPYTGNARLTDAMATTDVQAITFSRSDFEKAMTNNLNVALSAIRLLSKMLRQINSRIKKIS